MNKLTAEKCREQFEEWFADHAGQTVAWVKSQRASDTHYKIGPEIQRYWLTWQASRQALEIALPILEQQERGCQKCGGTGMADSGGTQPWGEQILIECDCKFEQQERGEGEWIEWGGGECPVGNLFSDTVMVIEVKFRTGNTEKSSRSEFYSWEHHERATDIIAYRIIPEQPNNQNGEK